MSEEKYSEVCNHVYGYCRQHPNCYANMATDCPYYKTCKHFFEMDTVTEEEFETMYTKRYEELKEAETK